MLPASAGRRRRKFAGNGAIMLTRERECRMIVPLLQKQS